MRITNRRLNDPLTITAVIERGMDLVECLPMEWNIGCSGYHHPDWRRIFYPEDINQRKWFEYYCTHFNTLEMNVTYYRFPRVESLKRWYDRSPRGFSFTVKAPRLVTHNKKFRNAQRLLHDFNETVREGLEDKLGCVLFQFPSTFHFEEDKLARVVEMLDPSVRSVVEFRHPSWWNPAVYEMLKQANIAFCGMSHPELPDRAVATTDTLYYRFQGVPHLYNSRYDIRTLERVAQEMFDSHARRAYVYFNNTTDGHAIFNAKQLQEICELVH